MPAFAVGETERLPKTCSFTKRMRREVLPYAPDTWYQPDSVKVGYEISFIRYFYKPQPMRALAEIHADILALEQEPEGLLDEIIGASESGSGHL